MYFVSRPYPRCTSRSPSDSCCLFLPGYRHIHQSCSRRACTDQVGTGCSAGAESTGMDYSDSLLASSPLSGLFPKGSNMEVFKKSSQMMCDIRILFNFKLPWVLFFDFHHAVGKYSHCTSELSYFIQNKKNKTGRLIRQ